MLTHKKAIKILDFDIENRPLSYWYDGKPTAEITAIAACWAHDPSSMLIGLLGVRTLSEILIDFVKLYDEADMVTGHNIRAHDLPIINGALMELNLPKLKAKLTCDTLKDMHKKGDMPASQEYLLDLFGLPEKVHMTQHMWREANRLTQSGRQKTMQRVSSDVYGHMRMREIMLSRGLLKSPRIWKP